MDILRVVIFAEIIYAEFIFQHYFKQFGLRYEVSGISVYVSY